MQKHQLTSNLIPLSPFFVRTVSSWFKKTVKRSGSRPASAHPLRGETSKPDKQEAYCRMISQYSFQTKIRAPLKKRRGLIPEVARIQRRAEHRIKEPTEMTKSPFRRKQSNTCAASLESLDKRDQELFSYLQKCNELYQQVNLSNSVLVPWNDLRFKYRLEEGNNHQVLKKAMFRRWWWEQTKESKQAQLLWSPGASTSFFQAQNESPPHAPPAHVGRPHYQGMLTEFHRLSIQPYLDALDGLLSPQIRLIMSSKLKVHNHLPSITKLTNKSELQETARKGSVQGLLPRSYVVKDAHSCEFQQFKQEFVGGSLWIVKPGENSNRGMGITIHYDLGSIVRRVENRGPGTSFVIQKYIQNPFLYNRRKIDFRHFILLTSINGRLKGYWYEEGYVRTSSYPYNPAGGLQVHLTNDAVQKKYHAYGKYEPCNKLSYQEIGSYLQNTRGISLQTTLLPKFKRIVHMLLTATGPTLDPTRKQHNFQLLGLDFMLDQNCRPYLIEINDNPSLSANCPLLKRLVSELVDNVLRVAVDPLFPPPCSWPSTKKAFLRQSLHKTNRFSLFYDQSYQ